MLKNKKFIIFLILLPCLSYAKIKPVINIMGGADSTRFKTSQNITLLPPFQDTFSGSNTDEETVGGIFLGIEKPIYENFLWQIGLSYYQATPFHANGSIAQFTNPEFTNLYYSTQVNNKRYMLETRLLSTLPINSSIHPYVIAALGESVNHAYQYSESPVQGYDVIHPDVFANHTTHSFSYSVGIGIDFDLSEHIRAGASYRYANLGRAQLGVMPSQGSNDTLNYNDLATNEYLLSLSYIG